MSFYYIIICFLTSQYDIIVHNSFLFSYFQDSVFMKQENNSILFTPLFE